MPSNVARVPASEDAEQAVLATCFLESTADPLGDVDPQQFYSVRHQQIAKAVLSLNEAGKPVDIVQALELLNQWHAGVTASELSGLLDSPIIGSKSLDWYREEIKRLWMERNTRRELSQMGEAAAAGAPVEDLQRRAVEVLEKAKPAKKEKTIPSGGCPMIPDGAWHPVACEYRDIVGPSLPEIPSNFHLACFLTAIGTALCHTVYYNIIRVENLYPNLFSVLVGTSGDPRKGTAMRGIVYVLQEAGISFPRRYSVDSAEGLATQLVKFQGPSVETYKPLMIYLSELSSFIHKANKEGTRNMIPKLCEAYDGTPYEVIKSKDSIIVDNPFVSIISGTSLAYTECMKVSDLKGGLGNRICFIPGEPKKRDAEPPDPAEPEYSRLTSKLAGIIDFWKSRGTTRLIMDDATRKIWKGFYEDELPTWTPTEELMEVLTKRFEHHVIKTAMIYAALDRSDVIRMEHLGPAMVYAKFLLESIYYIFPGFGLAQWVKDERKIIEKVRASMPLGIRQRSLQRHFSRMGSEHFQRHMKSLIGEESDLRIDHRGKQIWIVTNDD